MFLPPDRSDTSTEAKKERRHFADGIKGGILLSILSLLLFGGWLAYETITTIMDIGFAKISFSYIIWRTVIISGWTALWFWCFRKIWKMDFVDEEDKE